MKSFNEARQIIKFNIDDYLQSCKNSKNEIYSDKEAFFINLIPFGKHHGGQTGFHRAERFRLALKSKIKNGEIVNTMQLIDFSENYQDKGNRFRKVIWKFIREMAGFNEEHMKILIFEYQCKNERLAGNAIDYPNESESREASEGLVNDEIRHDYGKALLRRLNGKVSEVELICMDSVLARNSL